MFAGVFFGWLVNGVAAFCVVATVGGFSALFAVFLVCCSCLTAAALLLLLKQFWILLFFGCNVSPTRLDALCQVCCNNIC